MKTWNWIWPHVSGATPINQGLDSEMFDRSDYPYSETFVREAIQNSLDARLDPKKPVIVSFTFCSQTLDAQKGFLSDVFRFRQIAGLQVVADWESGSARWLVVEDFNSKGLGGDLEDRSSDFCNYWLNFGLSNKDGTQRGGRGIGRVTFLIASKIQTVIGYTRRYADGVTAACGMTVLRAQPDGKKFRSTHAYMAEAEKDSVLKLHGGSIHSELSKAFQLTGYDGEHKSGLALVIPYPHDELDGDGIMAATIEHFAPAIMSGSLVVDVDGARLDKDSIPVVSARIAGRFSADALKHDVAGYLGLIKTGIHGQPVNLKASGAPIALEETNTGEAAKKLQAQLQSGDAVLLEITLPLERHNKQRDVALRAVLRKTPDGAVPIDRLFREGMSLPDVRAKSPGELDLVVLIGDGDLATYLNFCEGKAHLDLLESKETKAKLESQGYAGPVTRVRRFIKNLPVSLRSLLTPDITEADATAFDAFFSIPSNEPGKQKGRRGDEPPAPPPPPPPPRISPFLVEPLADGLRVRANPKFTDWPVNVSISVAYADGSRTPDWSEYDFKLEDMPLEHEDCNLQFQGNRIQASNCGPSARVQVTGFDTRRELDTRIRTWKDAQAN
jgi:hypothetical protein